MTKEIKSPGELNLRQNPIDELFTSEWMAAIERQYQERRWAYVPLDTDDSEQIKRILTCFMHKGWHPVTIFREDNPAGILFFDALAQQLFIEHDIPVVRQVNIIASLTKALETTFACHHQHRYSVFIKRVAKTDLSARLFEIWDSRRASPRIDHLLKDQENHP